MARRTEIAATLPIGIRNPHSYRGYYDQLAFEPARPMLATNALEVARSAVGQVFDGYKGGNCRMTLDTECWLANYGCCGEEEEDSIDRIFGDDAPELARLRAEITRLRAANARLRGAINTALRQLADGNRVLATDTLARAVPTGGRSKP